MSITYDAKRTALLLLDLQPAILSLIADESVRANVISTNAALLKAARASGLQVAYVRVALTQSEYDNVPQRNKVFAGYRQMGVEQIGHAGLEVEQASAQIHPDLAPTSADDIQVRKPRSCPFVTTDLHQQLQRRGIDTLIITGVATGNCVLAAARHAENLDYAVTVVSDGCADVEQDVHVFVMQRLLSKVANVQTAHEAIQSMVA